MDLEKLKEKVKQRVRLIALSILFLMGTTFVSVFCLFMVWLRNRIGSFHLGQVTAGAIIGQVVLMISMQVISEYFAAQRIQESEGAIKDLEDLNGNELEN